MRSRDERLEVSVVLPAYNEAGRIKYAVERTIETLKEITQSYEVIIAEDGSTDGTDRIASRLSGRYPFVRHFHSDTRLGRGRALTNAFRSARGEILVYMDVDLGTDISYLKDLVESIREGYDMATGSRMLPGSRAERTPLRELTSRGYNFMVRALLGSEVMDHQCGFKSFRKSSLLSLLDEVSSSHWFWDTEVLVRGFRRGLRIKEFPIEWRHRGESKVDLIKDSFAMGIQLLKLWWKLRGQRSSFGEAPPS
jgi:hypothetical protein